MYKDMTRKTHDTVESKRPTSWLSPALLLFVLVLSPLGLRGQSAIGNLGQFDRRPLHYGIQVGYTQSKFDLAFSEN